MSNIYLSTLSQYSTEVVIDYTNHRGERRERTVVPHDTIYGSNEYHPKPCWMLWAWDVEKRDFRTFPFEHIHSIRYA